MTSMPTENLPYVPTPWHFQGAFPCLLPATPVPKLTTQQTQAESLRGLPSPPAGQPPSPPDHCTTSFSCSQGLLLCPHHIDSHLISPTQTSLSNLQGESSTPRTSPCPRSLGLHAAPCLLNLFLLSAFQGLPSPWFRIPQTMVVTVPASSSFPHLLLHIPMLFTQLPY